MRIEANFLAEADDRTAALACVALCRAIGNSAPMKPFVEREVMPGDVKGKELEDYIRECRGHLLASKLYGKNGTPTRCPSSITG